MVDIVYANGQESVLERIIILACKDYKDMKAAGIIRGHLPNVTIHLDAPFRRNYLHAGDVMALIVYIKEYLPGDLHICIGASDTLTVGRIIEEIDN